ncbi:MAG: TetR family transcriptional regulator [Pseudomonadales bacterium]|nr:TetR/AcrR family transcriptional regulator [Pseudomonadales bacterium]
MKTRKVPEQIPPNPVGRPSGEQGVEARGRLIHVAAERFAAQGFDGTSLKQVAEGAGVTPAMVAYYFKDKAGLLEAVVIDGLERLFGALEGAVAASQTEPLVPVLVRSYLRVISADPWIPQLLMREVISRDTPLRTLFVERFARRALALVPARVMEEMQAGRLNADLDPRFTLLSLIGICVFPFLAHPVLGPLFGYELDSAFGRSYGDHAVALLMRGMGAGGNSPDGPAGEMPEEAASGGRE